MGWNFSQAFDQKKYPRLRISLDPILDTWKMYEVETPVSPPRIVSVKRDRDELLESAAIILRVSGVQDARLQWEKK